MKVSVSLCASLAAHLRSGCSGKLRTLDLREGTLRHQLLDAPNIAQNERKIMLLNGIHARFEDILEEGDRFAVFPPIARG